MGATYDDVNRINSICTQMLVLLREAKGIARRTLDQHNMANFDAYVFDQIREHLEKSNPYNKDMRDIATAIENGINEDEDEDEDVPNPDADV